MKKCTAILIILYLFQTFIFGNTLANASSTISLPSCEYQITFPQSYKKLRYNAENNMGYIFVSNAGSGEYPSFRAQCLPLEDGAQISDDIVMESLKSQAESFGLDEIQIFIENSSIGVIGTYTGKKSLDGVKVIQMGRLYVGENSVLNLIATELLKNFPSKELKIFMYSAEKIQGLQ